MEFFKMLARRFPDLELKLKQARIKQEPEDYVKKNFIVSIYVSFSISLILFFFFKNIAWFALGFLLTPLMFSYFMKSIDLKILKAAREVEREIIFAGRFLVIELESGIIMDKAFENVALNFTSVGKYFREIVEAIHLGTPLEEAINQAIEASPSKQLKRMFWQLLNAVKTGGDVAKAINSVIEQIVREQQIAVREYGRKLSPFAMFYMTIGIIAPSIGTILFTVLSLFSGLRLTLGLLLGIAFMVGLVQSGFLYMIKGRRPPVEM